MHATFTPAVKLGEKAPLPGREHPVAAPPLAEVPRGATAVASVVIRVVPVDRLPALRSAPPARGVGGGRDGTMRTGVRSTVVGFVLGLPPVTTRLHSPPGVPAVFRVGILRGARKSPAASSRTPTRCRQPREAVLRPYIKVRLQRAPAHMNPLAPRLVQNKIVDICQPTIHVRHMYERT